MLRVCGICMWVWFALQAAPFESLNIHGTEPVTTHYEILNLHETASAQEITKAYRGLARKYHPDKNLNDPTAPRRFKNIGTAYEILKDPERRAVYDASLRDDSLEIDFSDLCSCSTGKLFNKWMLFFFAPCTNRQHTS